MDYNNY